MSDEESDGYELYCCYDRCIIQGMPADSQEEAETLRDNHVTSNPDHEVEIRQVGGGEDGE